MRLVKFLAPVAAVLAIAGCGGGSSHHRTVQKASPPVPSAVTACPQAANGHGRLGICAPQRQKLQLAPPRATPGPVYPDRSNNDPCNCGASIKAAGQVGLIVKANQGTGFVDSTAVGMVASARAAGLAVGEYDFDQDYSVSEARVFESRLKAAGIFPNTSNTFPAYFDVEFGNFSYAGLKAQIGYLQSQGYRVGIYTGDWFWRPHAGCAWPGVTAWISGFPNAILPCGLPVSLYQGHQFTDSPTDLTVFRGSLTQFRAFVHVQVTPVPKPSPLTVLQKGPFSSPYGNLNEKLVAAKFQGAWEHRVKYRGYLHGLLHAELQYLANRNAYMAQRVYHSWSRYKLGSRRAVLQDLANQAARA